MTRKRLLIICVLLCVILFACGTEETDPEPSGSETAEPSGSETTEPSEGEGDDISALLFRREDITGVDIPVERRRMRVFSAVANEAESEAILDQLFNADISEFTDADLAGAEGVAVRFMIRTEGAARYLQIIKGDNALYIVINDYNPQFIVLDGGEPIRMKGPADSFDFDELDRLMGDVMRNESDPDYSGTVTIMESGEKLAVKKADCAYARSHLDTAVDELGTADGDADALYDIEFKIGGTLYWINSETGQFYRDEAGEIMYAQLEDQHLRIVGTHLGVRKMVS